MIGIRVRITVGIRIRIGLGLRLGSVFVVFAMKRDVTRYATDHARTERAERRSCCSDQVVIFSF